MSPAEGLGKTDMAPGKAILCLILLFLTACSQTPIVQFPSARLSAAAENPPTVSGYLAKPEGMGPFPAVLLLHGCAGIGPSENTWREWLRGQGFVTLAVDSFTPRGVGNICSHLQRVQFSARIADAFGGLDYLAAQPFVDRDRISVMGLSNGGAVTLAVAAPSSWISRPTGSAQFRTAIALYPECLTHLGKDDPPPAIPILILIGALDDWTLATSCQKMRDRYKGEGQPINLVVLSGARHAFDNIDLPLTVLPTAMNINRPGGVGATIEGNAPATEQAKVLVARFLTTH